MSAPEDPPPSGPVTCSFCGVTVENPPVEWVLETDVRRGRQWICTACARTHLRAIEAKLQQEWW